jgi:hypothetical protein
LRKRGREFRAWFRESDVYVSYMDLLVRGEREGYLSPLFQFQMLHQKTVFVKLLFFLLRGILTGVHIS